MFYLQEFQRLEVSEAGGFKTERFQKWEVLEAGGSEA
jgi:hypothetical protein